MSLLKVLKRVEASMAASRQRRIASQWGCSEHLYYIIKVFSEGRDMFINADNGKISIVDNMFLATRFSDKSEARGVVNGSIVMYVSVIHEFYQGRVKTHDIKFTSFEKKIGAMVKVAGGISALSKLNDPFNVFEAIVGDVEECKIEKPEADAVYEFVTENFNELVTIGKYGIGSKKAFCGGC